MFSTANNIVCRMVERRISFLWTCFALLALTTAGPLHRYPREADDDQSMDLSAYANYTANEVCFSDNEVFQRGALMPNPGPCEECRCEPPSIVCHMVKCPVNNNGCRTLQRPNHCCPDYNCECDYNGQLYNDGERIDLPEEPCQVCYCKGGDVMCTSITCYQRDDCEPIHVPGQCCPKYENCPLRDQPANGSDDKNVRSRSPNHSPKREMQPWLLTKSILQTSSLPVPKPVEDLTTEDSVIIVSDWLSERRSTTEDAIKQEDSSFHTLGPAVVTFSHFPTYNRYTASTLNPDGSVVRQSETISPLDEVIFTRVDIARGRPEINKESSTSAPPNTTKQNSSIPSDSSKYDKQTTARVVIVKDETTTISTPDIAINHSNKSELHLTVNSPVNVIKENEKQHNAESNLLNNSDIIDTTVSQTHGETLVSLEESRNKDTETSSDIFTTADYFTSISPKDNILLLSKINVIKDKDSLNANPTLTSESNQFNKDLQIQTFETSNKHSAKPSTQEISLDNVFSFEKSNEEDTNTEISPSKNMDKYAVGKLLDNSQDNKYLNIEDPATTEYLETSTNGGTTLNLSKLSPRVLPGKMNLDENMSSEEVLSSSGFITTESSIDVQTTTPYITEDHVSRLNLKYDEVVEDSHLIEDSLQFEEATTYFESTTPETTVSAFEYDELKRNIVQINIVDRTSKENSNTEVTVVENKEDTTGTSTNNGVFSDQLKSFNPVEDIVPSRNGPYIEEMNVEGIIGNDDTATTEESTAYVQQTVTFMDQNSEESVEHSIDGSSDSNQFQVNETSESIEEFTRKITKEDINNESREVISNPPILELNSHVPFLQIGGHFNSDSYSGVHDKKNETNPADKIVNVIDKQLNSSSVGLEKYETHFISIPLEDTTTSIETTTNLIEENDMLNNNVSDIHTTSHIPLTPGDLKVIAEYMIKNKIKPVKEDNASTYSENQWLKGNLTSEEKIASILSAANITVGIINPNKSETKSLSPETSTNMIEIIKKEKYDKEGLFKGNSIFNEKSTISKHSKTYDVSKSYSKTERYSDTTVPVPDEVSLINIFKDMIDNKSSSSTKGSKDKTDPTDNHYIESIEVPQKNLTESTFLVSSPYDPVEYINKTSIGQISAEMPGISRTQRISDSREEIVTDGLSNNSEQSQGTPKYHKNTP